jgi:hypothetical protein
LSFMHYNVVQMKYMSTIARSVGAAAWLIVRKPCGAIMPPVPFVPFRLCYRRK